MRAVMWAAPAVVAVAGAAAIGDARPDDATAAPSVLSLVGTVSAAQVLDVGAAGASDGDAIVVRQDLVAEYDDNVPLGTAALECRLAGGTLGQCLATLRLPEGQLALQGAVDLAVSAGDGSDGAPAEALPALDLEQLQEGDLAVTGGTGRYRRARGEAHVRRLGTRILSIVVRYR